MWKARTINYRLATEITYKSHDFTAHLLRSSPGHPIFGVLIILVLIDELLVIVVVRRIHLIRTYLAL